MAEFSTILTTVGLAKMANATVTQSPIQFTSLAVGDSNGSYYTPTSDQIALKHEVWRGNISSVYVDDSNANWIVIESVIPSNIGGFTIREVGLFDIDGDLIAVGKYPATYKPVLDDGSTKDIYLRVIIEVANTSAITLKIDPSVALASKEYVTKAIEKLIPKTDIENVISSSTTKVASAASVKLVDDKVASHQAEDATNAKKGHVQLVDDVNGNSNTLVPTQNAVRKKVEQSGYKMIKSGKDSNGVFTVVEEYRKSDNTLAEKSVLSGGTSPKYTTRTITYYGIDGTTVEKTETFTLSYDTDGDCTSEV